MGIVKVTPLSSPSRCLGFEFQGNMKEAYLDTKYQAYVPKHPVDRSSCRPETILPGGYLDPWKSS